jgi:hypothetical protein
MTQPPNEKEINCCANCKETEYGEIFMIYEDPFIKCDKHKKVVCVYFICDDYEQIWIGESDGN